jgi:hypothetical protein
LQIEDFRFEIVFVLVLRHSSNYKEHTKLCLLAFANHELKLLICLSFLG